MIHDLKFQLEQRASGAPTSPGAIHARLIARWIMEQVKKKKGLSLPRDFCGQLARAREGVCFEFQLDPLSSSLCCSSSLSPCRANEVMVGFLEIERQEKEEERSRIVLIDDAGVDGRRSNIYHRTISDQPATPAISLSILVQFDLKSLDYPRPRRSRSVQIDIDSTTRPSSHSPSYTFPHSSPFILVHLSVPNINHLRIPSALPSTRNIDRNRNRNHFHTSASLWS
jgi:hypothetical protein